MDLIMKKRKGIILAGGLGTRFFPVTNGLSKHLLPIFDKPMIYYSLSTLMLANIRDILLISTSRDIPIFNELLGNGDNWGLKINYLVQESPDGIAQALIISEEYLAGSPCVLILGDNFFYGDGLQQRLLKISRKNNGATIFCCKVKDPERYGVAELDLNGKVTNLIEKPNIVNSNYAIAGLYFYDENASKYAKELLPSQRGELEITDLNKIYLEKGNLFLEKLGRGYAWLDAGTPDSLLEACQFVQTIEHRQGVKICCPEEIAYKKGWLSKEKIISTLKQYKNSSYIKYIYEVLEN